jgi:hypothetical protein
MHSLIFSEERDEDGFSALQQQQHQQSQGSPYSEECPPATAIQQKKHQHREK